MQIRNYNELVDAFRARQLELGLSNEALDHRAGLTPGHTDKLLGPSRARGIGPMTLGRLLDALGVSLAMVVADTPEKFTQTPLERRQEALARDNGRISKAVIKKARPFVLAAASRHAARKKWDKMSQEQRQEILSSVRAQKRSMK